MIKTRMAGVSDLQGIFFWNGAVKKTSIYFKEKCVPLFWCA